ncbi:hypothetical protein NUW54_g11947 [Trametes sanguinea]|uniref:Uncharacterized protein n=1 Tax=Trametes sanguinea TaxID=158606 RepID=A0ACC1N474_9APHY|nr:hypothetical protein NUW54_g11947 [Trametes sanguinea]
MDVDPPEVTAKPVRGAKRKRTVSSSTRKSSYKGNGTRTPKQETSTPATRPTKRLKSRLDSLELFRCNAVFRERQSLPEALLTYSRYNEGLFKLPPLDVLTAYKVIVSTCGNASFAYNVGMPNGHFSHIFIDEAGQASEPEVLCAIKTMAAPKTRVILSGDPKQLGPVIRSSIARELGLGISYLERLMDRPVYDSVIGQGRSFVKLVKNFRSHNAILDYPNEQFYGGELEVCGPSATINSLLRSPALVNSRWPVVFHHISGQDERESTSPSYFNIDEATEVLEYIKTLLNDHSHPIRSEEIGVIAPYYAQVRKIRLLLRREHIEDVKVGSVEEFQGQERRVIIISTVRSTRDMLSYDAKFTLGFVSNPRRFNVAVTRAQALLVVTRFHSTAVTPGTPSSVRRTRSQRALPEERPPSRQKPVPSPPQRKSSRLTNGRSPTKPAIIALREEEEEDEDEVPQPAVVAPSGLANGPATDGDETKYEDADTPATGATHASRHSDDTVVGGELARNKLSPVALTAGHPLPNGVDEDDLDADAEGEDDLDAEGESDIEEEL